MNTYRPWLSGCLAGALLRSGGPLRLGLAAVFLYSGVCMADSIRRIALDGKDGVPAPVQEDGKDGIARIHKVEQASLELFPTTNKPARGTVLLSPGGGYGILAITHEGRDVAPVLNSAGYDVAVLLYHVSEGDKTREMALADAKAALDLLRTRGGDLGLSTARIGAMGFSAGGHLSTRLAHESAAAGKPLDFLVLMYPAYLNKDGSVIDDVSPTKIPTFVYVASDDPYLKSSLAYVDACKQQGIACDFHQPESGGHGFGMKSPLPESVRDWPDRLTSFLRDM
jgi:acetyl esterase/lipase